jgi:hypothetical protein
MSSSNATDVTLRFRNVWQDSVGFAAFRSQDIRSAARTQTTTNSRYLEGEGTDLLGSRRHAALVIIRPDQFFGAAGVEDVAFGSVTVPLIFTALLSSFVEDGWFGTVIVNA